MMIKRLAACMLAAVLCVTAFSTVAFAGGDDWCEYGDYGTPDTEAAVSDSATEAPTVSEPVVNVAVTETVVDDTTESSSGTKTHVIDATVSMSSGVEPDKAAEDADVTPSVSESENSEKYDVTVRFDLESLYDSAFSGMTLSEDYDFDDFSEYTDEDDGNGLTPDGNLTLVDDYAEENEDGSGKQFITLVTKDGNYFYLIIDRDEDGEENVHFLNLVDEADLFALMDEDEIAEYTASVEETKEPAVTETEEPEPVETEEPDSETGDEENKSINFAPILLILVLVGVGGYFAFTKLKKSKKKVEKAKPDPDADYVDEMEDDSDFDIPDDVEDEEDESTMFDADDNEPV